MAKNIFLNVLLNIAIITLGLCAIWSYNHQLYIYMGCAILALVMFIYLKAKFVKKVRGQITEQLHKKHQQSR
ncbi:MAG TPA: DUF6358 family protein [Daejeonella sp.]|nr:DUF6358 family protein [Daejeonella sp.]